MDVAIAPLNAAHQAVAASARAKTTKYFKAYRPFPAQT
jgi:hypothetical protein